MSGDSLPKTDRELWRWQNRLLPFMLGAVITMTAFFLVASLWVFVDFRGRMESGDSGLAKAFVEYEGKAEAKGTVAHEQYLRFKVAALLEQDSIARRYQQANSMILARVWTRYLGFLTGMTLCMVGAFFVLGQLRTEGDKLEASAEGLKAAIATSSPGLVLATLGTVLMAISLSVQFEVDTRDKPLYMAPARPGQALTTPPESLPSDAPGEGATVSPAAGGGRTPADEMIESAPRSNP